MGIRTVKPTSPARSYLTYVTYDEVTKHEPEKHEEEILALYLAIFLHEFGMLRLQGGKSETDWNDLISRSIVDEKARKLLEGELNLVRNLHAVR